MTVKTGRRVDKASYMSAITRKTISAPAKWLKAEGLVLGTTLDYGCGKGSDAEVLGADKYDSYYFPHEKLRKQYRTILCTYVINTIENDKSKLAAIRDVQSMLTKTGVSYVTVRRDIKIDGPTAKGTYQETVKLNLESIHKTAGYEVYKLVKTDKVRLVG